MPKFLFFLLTIANVSGAFAEQLLCKVTVNTEVQTKKEITVLPDEKVTFADVDSFRMMVKNLGSAKFEVEVFDGNEPSRGYAKGSLKTSDDEVRWTLWRRDILLETSCQLSNPLRRTSRPTDQLTN